MTKTILTDRIYAGLDVSVKSAHVCLMDGDGHVLKEQHVANDPT